MNADSCCEGRGKAVASSCGRAGRFRRVFLASIADDRRRSRRMARPKPRSVAADCARPFFSPPEHHTLPRTPYCWSILAVNLRADTTSSQAEPGHPAPSTLPTQPSPQRHSTSPLPLSLHRAYTLETLEAMSLRIVSLATALLAASSAVHAIGDFPCSGSTDSQSCAAWSVDPNAQGTISATAVCQPGACPRKWPSSAS